MRSDTQYKYTLYTPLISKRNNIFLQHRYRTKFGLALAYIICVQHSFSSVTRISVSRVAPDAVVFNFVTPCFWKIYESSGIVKVVRCILTFLRHFKYYILRIPYYYRKFSICELQLERSAGDFACSRFSYTEIEMFRERLIWQKTVTKFFINYNVHADI